MMRENESLAEQRFWDDEYLAEVALPSRPDPEVVFERSLARALARLAPVALGGRVLEVGCAPAKWLVFYAERFGAVIEGIEYSAKGAELSRENFRLAGVEGTIHHADFRVFEPRGFDLVLSLGFIEHFEDLEGMFARHVGFVAPHGRLVIGVPNFRGVNRALQRLSDPGHLRLHNLAAMKPALYRELAERHGLREERIEHLGGFDPIIIKLGRPLGRRLVNVVALSRRLGLGDRVNHPWLSSYLLVVLRRPG
jgi:SAM-dependent methyltransferase